MDTLTPTKLLVSTNRSHLYSSPWSPRGPKKIPKWPRKVSCKQAGLLATGTFLKDQWGILG